MTEYRIPLYRPSLEGNETKYVLECLETSWISGRGPFVAKFEAQFAGKLKVRHGLATCNGTAALHLALAGLGIGPGDEVILPTLTYVASANAVAYTGAVPVFVDCLRDTWQMDPLQIRDSITPKTKVIMAVHLYGQPCDMDAIMALAARYDLFVIEDCAEAFGSSYRGQPVGSFGHVAAFSFFGNKTVTTGEGGMVLSNDPHIMERCRRLRGHGLVQGREYWHDLIGFNYRMSNIAAAIGLAQLERADELVRGKRQLAERYFARLSHLPLLFHRETAPAVHAYWMVSALARSQSERDALRRHLAAEGIETRPVFHPLHSMGIHQARVSSTTAAEDIAARGLSLPSWPDMPESDFNFVCRSVEGFF